MLPDYCFCGLPECVNEWSLCAFSLAPLLLSVLSNSNVLVFVLPYYIFLLSLEACLFLMIQQGGEELAEAKGGKTTIRIYYVRGKPIFNKKGKSLKNKKKHTGELLQFKG